ncbi:ATP-grasp domain-containing protein [Geodermatophilus sp. SYSU D00766]
MNIVISSAGRRLYLVEWFRSAMDQLGVAGDVIVADQDPLAAALAAGDAAVRLPVYSDPAYAQSLLDLCQDRNVGLLISLNDYEALLIAQTVMSTLLARGTQVPILDAETARLAADKWAAVGAFAASDIAVPRSALGTSALTPSGADLIRCREIVVKHRFGSSSSGLLFGDAADLRELVLASAKTAPNEFGEVLTATPRPELVIVQERLSGAEFGIDILSDLTGQFKTCFARRKLRMRAGETDQAVTVDNSPFLPLAVAVHSVVRARGLMDMDVILDESGVPRPIDLNPRFGGGYPFSHLAGADAPACLVAWAAGLPISEEWLRPAPGVYGAKHPSIVCLGSGSSGESS